MKVKEKACSSNKTVLLFITGKVQCRICNWDYFLVSTTDPGLTSPMMPLMLTLLRG